MTLNHPQKKNRPSSHSLGCKQCPEALSLDNPWGRFVSGFDL
jgi:hypothetical protein